MGRAFDIGAGIGRVTKTILQVAFDDIDILDQSPVQIEEAKKYVPFVKNFYVGGYQDHIFEYKYDLIWLQWFLMYLTDDDLVLALKRTADNLTISEETGQSGLIFIKENVKQSGAYLDKEDNCIIRNPIQFKLIWEAAGLECIHASY